MSTPVDWCTVDATRMDYTKRLKPKKTSIQQESRTLATISIQNYFRLYKTLRYDWYGGNRGGGIRKIYSVDVIAVPTNMPVIREDKADIIYKTTGAKYTAIANEIERLHKIGQPILVGTRSINHNQIVSDFLNRKRFLIRS